MKKVFLILFYFCFVFTFLIAGSDNTRLNVSSKESIKHEGVKVSPDYGKIPLYFIKNRGQVNKKVIFYSRTRDYTLWFTDEGLVFDSIKGEAKKDFDKKLKNESKKPEKYLRDVSRLKFIGARKDIKVEAIDETGYRVNYFIGKERKKGEINLPTSKSVGYRGIYKGIDLKVYGVEKQIEYDWIIKEGGDPDDIVFEYEGVKGTSLNKEGDIIIETKFGNLIHKRPVAYQEGEEGRVEVSFKEVSENRYSFRVGEYNNSKDLIIDPVVLVYSTYIGGGSTDYGYAIAVDSSGYAYITGRTYSTDYPTQNPYMLDPGDVSDDVFVTKLSSNIDSDISIQKQVSNISPKINDNITYTITVTNNGPDSASNLTIKDKLPVELSYQSSSSSKGTYNNSTGIWNIGSLSDGENSTLNIVARVVDSGKNIVNTARVLELTENAPVSSNNSASVTITTNHSVTVTVSGGHGSVSPSTQDISYGGYATINITLDTGYEIESIVDNGVSKPITNPYVINNISENHDVVVKFRPSIILNLSATRETKGAWIVRKQYGKIVLNVNNPMNISVSRYIIFRSVNGGSYESLEEVSSSFGGTYTYFDKYLEKNKTYSYYFTALDSSGTILSLSNVIVLQKSE